MLRELLLLSLLSFGLRGSLPLLFLGILAESDEGVNLLSFVLAGFLPQLFFGILAESDEGVNLLCGCR